MDPQVSGSFIPKKPLVADVRAGTSAMGLFMLLSILIFVTSLVAAGAVFAYTQFLKSSIAFKQDSLSKAQNAYDPGVIEDLIRLDDRIVESRNVLGAHVAPSAVFAFLSNQTLENVQFGKFELKMNNEEGGTTLSLEGQADNFSTIALQSDQFGASKVLKDVIFSDLVISAETGRVTFTVTAAVDPPFLLYSRNLTTAPAPVIQTAPENPPEEQTLTTPEEMPVIPQESTEPPVQ